jgi:hypothetical protein
MRRFWIIYRDPEIPPYLRATQFDFTSRADTDALDRLMCPLCQLLLLTVGVSHQRFAPIPNFIGVVKINALIVRRCTLASIIWHGSFLLFREESMQRRLCS